MDGEGWRKLKAVYRREMYGNYLILSEGEALPPDAYQIKMITTNEIPGFLKCCVHEMDGKRLFYFDVTSRQTFQSVLEYKKVSAELLELLFRSIYEAMEQLSDYLLDPGGLMLRPEYMYMDPARKEIRFCYYPESDESFREQLKALGEYLLQLLDHGDRRAVFLGYEFYRISAGENLTADIFLHLLRECGQSAEPTAKEAGEEPVEEQMEETAPDAEKLFFEADGESEEKNRKSDRKRAKKETTEERSLHRFFARHGAQREKKKRKEKEEREKRRLSERFLMWWNKRRDEDPDEDVSLEELLGEEWMEMEILEEMDRDEAEGARMAETEDTNVGSGLSELSVGRSHSTVGVNAYTDCEGDVPDEDGSYETVSLGERKAVPRLADREKAILIPQPEFGKSVIALENDSILIGKSRRAADLVLSSAAVSRIHARMLWDGETYRIEDQNSRNGTRLNGEILQSGELYVLRDGDLVEFADLKFIYRRIGEEK